jgi:hypothetical protein
LSSEPDFWTKLERGLAVGKPPPTDVSAPTEATSKPGASRLPRTSKFLDVLGLLLWTYLFLKVFVADIDRLAVESIAPSGGWIVNYRALLYLGFIAAMALTFRRRWLAYLYVIFFPVVVIGWKIPRFFYRHRSWPLFLGSIQAIVSVSTDLRYNVSTKAVALIASLLILLTNSWPLLILSSIYLSALLVWSFVRTFRRTFTSTSFTSLQRTWIRRIVDSSSFKTFVALKDEYKRPGVVEYASADAHQLATTMSIAIAANKLMYLWAYQLDRYRSRYSPGLVFNGLSFAWVFLSTVTGLALINLAVFKFAPGQYVVHSAPSLLSFLVYTLARGGGIEGVGQIALVIQLVTAITLGLVIVSLLLHVVMTIRRERDEAATKELVADLKVSAQELESRFKQEYEVGVNEAWRRLQELKAGFATLIT